MRKATSNPLIKVRLTANSLLSNIPKFILEKARLDPSTGNAVELFIGKEQKSQQVPLTLTVGELVYITQQSIQIEVRYHFVKRVINRVLPTLPVTPFIYRTTPKIESPHSSLPTAIPTPQIEVQPTTPPKFRAQPTRPQFYQSPDSYNSLFQTGRTLFSNSFGYYGSPVNSQSFAYSKEYPRTSADNAPVVDDGISLKSGLEFLMNKKIDS